MKKHEQNPNASLPGVWPVSRGNTSVTIRYETPRGNRKAYRLEWVENGKDQSQMYKTLEEAKTGAEALAVRLEDCGRALRRVEIDELRTAKATLDNFAVTLNSADIDLSPQEVFSDYIAAHKLLPGWTMTSAATFIVNNHGIKNRMTVSDAFAAYLKYMESGVLRDYSDSWKKCSRAELENFAAEYGDYAIDSISPEQGIDYLSTMMVDAKLSRGREDESPNEDGYIPASRKTKNIAHSILRLAFAYAKRIKQALPPRLETVFEIVEAPDFEVPTPQIYTPVELKKLLAAMPDVECLLYVCLQAFAGLRACEAAALAREAIKEKNGRYSHILVNREIAKKSPEKTQRRKSRQRRAPITPPLQALLIALVLASGPLIHTVKVQHRAMKAAAEAGLAWKHNALRHSFITYRLAKIKNRHQVAYEAGHGIAVQIEHYENLVDDNDIKPYWSLVPCPDGLPFTLNPNIVGVQFVNEYALAKAAAQKAA
jgi:integrase